MERVEKNNYPTPNTSTGKAVIDGLSHSNNAKSSLRQARAELEKRLQEELAKSLRP